MARLLPNLLLHMKPKRGWAQFSLRSMLLLTTLCGIWLGWRVNEVHHQREVLAIVQSLGAYANFDYQCDVLPDRLVLEPGRQPPSNSWLRRTIGQEYPQRIASLDFGGTSLTDQDVERLAGLSGLLMLNLSNSQVTDAELAHLQRLSGLRGIDLRNTQVTDAGLAKLRTSLPNCQIDEP